MKKLLILTTILLITGICFSQTRYKQVADTTKPKQDTSYYLIGSLNQWQTMYKALVSPENMTRKEISEMQLWLQRLQAYIPPKTDTTKKK